MNNSDILRRLRYALNITDGKVIELFRLAGYEIARPELESIFKREDEDGYVECDDSLMEKFLAGLVIARRGKREGSPKGDPKGGPKGGVEGKPPRSGRARLSNNDILKSLRIALELKAGDLFAILRLAGVEPSKSELSALFRKRDHPNYRPCGDQFLRSFLSGLTAKYRV